MGALVADQMGSHQGELFIGLAFWVISWQSGTSSQVNLAIAYSVVLLPVQRAIIE
jgi:hypothetical protein